MPLPPLILNLARVRGFSGKYKCSCTANTVVNEGNYRHTVRQNDVAELTFETYGDPSCYLTEPTWIWQIRLSGPYKIDTFRESLWNENGRSSKEVLKREGAGNVDFLCTLLNTLNVSLVSGKLDVKISLPSLPAPHTETDEREFNGVASPATVLNKDDYYLFGQEISGAQLDPTALTLSYTKSIDQHTTIDGRDPAYYLNITVELQLSPVFYEADMDLPASNPFVMGTVLDKLHGTQWQSGSMLSVSNNPEQVGAESSDPGYGYGMLKGKDDGILFHTGPQRTARSDIHSPGRYVSVPIEQYIVHLNKYPGNKPAHIYICAMLDRPAEQNLPFPALSYACAISPGNAPEAGAAAVALAWLSNALHTARPTEVMAGQQNALLFKCPPIPARHFIECRIKITPPQGYGIGVFVICSSNGAATLALLDSIIAAESAAAAKPINGWYGSLDRAAWGRNAALFPSSHWSGKYTLRIPKYGHYLGLGINTHGAKPYDDAWETVQTAAVKYSDSKDRSYMNYGARFTCEIELANTFTTARRILVSFAAFGLKPVDRVGFFGPIRVKAVNKASTFEKTINMQLSGQGEGRYKHDLFQADIEPDGRLTIQIDFYAPGFSVGSHGLVIDSPLNFKSLHARSSGRDNLIYAGKIYPLSDETQTQAEHTFPREA